MNSRYIALFALASAVLLAPMAGCGKPAASSQAAKPDGAASAAPPQPSLASTPAAAKSEAGDLTTARAVMEKMAAAYRNAASYEDFATVDLFQDGAKEPLRADFRVVFQRPNKLRMTCYHGELACDGKRWFGYTKDIPFQAVLRDAPAAITLDMLTCDKELDRALNRGFAGMSPQLVFLLGEQPVDALLEGVSDKDLKLGDSVQLGDYNCYRVCYRQAEGSIELWIDQKTFVLRHMQFTADTPPGSSGETPNPDRMEAHFERARLGGPIDPQVFTISVPEGTECHRALMNAASFRVIGTKLDDFQLVDLRGSAWKSQSLAGKIAVLHLWRTDAAACADVVPGLQQAYEKYKDNPRVAFFAINLDGSQMDAKTIEETARKWKLTMPLLRDPNGKTAEVLKNADAPTTFIIDAQGVVQDRVRDNRPLSTAATARKIEDLMSGRELATLALRDANERFKGYEADVDKVFAGEVATATFKQPGLTPAASRSQPRKLKLTSLWKCRLNGIPANLIVAPVGGQRRILVVDGYKAITEIGLDGAIRGSHPVNLTEKEAITTLRTAAGGDGKQWFAAFAPWHQRMHVFDENLKQVLRYPEDALENPHPGITDVELADLLGNGQINVYIGFGGSVGVKCISLQGKLLASCRTLFNIGRIAAGPPDAMKHRQLYCVTDAGNVAVLDPKLQPSDFNKLASDGILEGLMQADLAGDGRLTWCAVLRRPDASQPAAGQYTAIGLDLRGAPIWKYDLPSGSLRSVEPIVVGRVLPGAASQWLLPGSDGSVHILAADGTLIDRFNYGTPINGLAATEIDGKPALLISSAGGVEALRVE